MPDAVVQSITVTVPPLENAERITLSMPQVLGDVAQIDALLRCQAYASEVAETVESMKTSIEVGKSYFPVSYYGAKGDGTTDDTAAIQAAINAAASVKGGEVVLGPGGHKVTSTLTWPSPPVWPAMVNFRGVNPSSYLSVNLNQPFDGNAIIKVAGSGLGQFQSNVSLRDFYIYCWDDLYTDDPAHPVGILVEDASAVQLSRVTVDGVNNNGILLRGVWDIYLDTVYVRACGRRSSDESYGAVQIDSVGKTGLGTTNTIYMNGVDIEMYRGIGLYVNGMAWLHAVNCKLHACSSSVPWASLCRENMVLSDVYGGSLCNFQVYGNTTSVLGSSSGAITFGGAHDSVTLSNFLVWANADDRPVLIKSSVVGGGISIDNMHFGTNTNTDGYIKIENGAGWVTRLGNITKNTTSQVQIINDGRLGSLPIETAAW